MLFYMFWSNEVAVIVLSLCGWIHLVSSSFIAAPSLLNCDIGLRRTNYCVISAKHTVNRRLSVNESSESSVHTFFHEMCYF